jgi:hypothetical protein
VASIVYARSRRVGPPPTRARHHPRRVASSAPLINAISRFGPTGLKVAERSCQVSHGQANVVLRTSSKSVSDSMTAP